MSPRRAPERDILALHGGRPVRSTLLPYGRHVIGEDDIRAVVKVLRSDWITTGPKIAEFEKAFAARVKARYAVCFSSGTAALHGAVLATRAGPGDEAIVPTLTFCATANCALFAGVKPVFADILPGTLTLDPAEMMRRATRRTKIVLPVDYAGHPSDVGPIMDWAQRRGVTVIQDACHSLGALDKGRPVGSQAHMTVFSFHPVKHITTGEGGMVTTSSAVFAQRLRSARNHGIASDARERQRRGQWFYRMTDLGYNYRLTDMGCALGLSQLKKLSKNLARRREIAERYTKAFADWPALQLPEALSRVKPAWHLYPLRLNLDALRVNRNEIFKAMRAENIGVNVHYIPVHLHPYYRERFGTRPGQFPIAEGAYKRLISLPMSHGLTDSDVRDVIRAVHKVIRHYGKKVPQEVDKR
jgi:perosamine synthetase